MPSLVVDAAPAGDAISEGGGGTAGLAPAIGGDRAGPAVDGDRVAPATASDGAHGNRIEGNVTDPDGQPVEEAYVLVQARGERFLQNATAGDEPIRESLLALVEEHPYGLYWNATTESGSYVVHVPRVADYDVIAVTEDGVSRLRTVSVRVRRAEQDLAVDPDRILSLETGDPSATPGEVAAVELRVPNPGERPVEDLSVALELPAGWTVEGVETDGDWDADARRVTFDRVAPGETATATVRVRVPADVDRGLHRIELAADARRHFVEHVGGVQVRVAPPGAATPTLTPTATERRFTFESPSSPGGPPARWLYLLSAGVFAVGAAFAGYSVWRTVGLR